MPDEDTADRVKLADLRAAVNREADKLEALLRQFREIARDDDHGSHTHVSPTDHH